MTYARRKALPITLGLVSIITQALLIAYYWWDLDPRVSCDGLLYWDDWIACLRGKDYIQLAYFAFSSWLSAGVAGIYLGRFLPPYVSIIVPAGGVVCLLGYANWLWHESVTPYMTFGEAAPSDILVFTMRIGLTIAFLVGPVVGAWLWGLGARASRRQLQNQNSVTVKVFE